MGVHEFNPAGNRLFAKYMLSKSGITKEQIAGFCVEWDKKDVALRVSIPVEDSIQLLDAANAKGMTDGEYISDLLRRNK